MLDESNSPDSAEIPSVLRRVQVDTMNAVLSAWVDEARRQWRNAVCLLAAEDPDVERVRRGSYEPVPITHLMPAYWALAARYSEEVVGAPQPDIFSGDYENQLHGKWIRFAIDYMRDGDRPIALRMVLQATIGLKGGRDLQAAGQSLLDHVRDTPLGGW